MGIIQILQSVGLFGQGYQPHVITLRRFETGDQGTFGKVDLPKVSLFSGELPSKDNLPNISCIPTGEYTCEYTYSEHFQRKLYLVNNVEKREGIRIHPANFMGDVSLGWKSELNGCIALGFWLREINGQKALLFSRSAVKRFEEEMMREPFELTIVTEYVS